ncbi:MAG TPA: cation diffusion facilitator family transporter, partial [Polyangiaceae bacterium]|nr:cation diffusion facilitator family transporter [Polyangiaceae bacterium]
VTHPPVPPSVAPVSEHPHDHDHGEDHGQGHDHGHDHGSGHGHDHGHDHGGPGGHESRESSVVHGSFTAGEARQARRLGMVLALVGSFFVLELAGAIWAESVVLQADALHLLMDVLALGVSLFAMRLAVRRPTPRFTYGLRRAEPVAAIFSALLVLVTTVGIVIEAVEALHGRGAPRAGLMLVVAVMALLVNGVSAALLHDAIHHRHGDASTHGGGHDGHGHGHGHGHRHAHGKARGQAPPHGRGHGHMLNLRGARLHLLGDTLGALAALCAAVVIRCGGSPIADPIAGFVVAFILVAGSVRLLRDATLVLLEAAPPHLPVAAVRQVVVAFPGVDSLRELHVWSLGAGHDAVTVHVRSDSRDAALAWRLAQELRRALRVEYVTVQVEPGEGG